MTSIQQFSLFEAHNGLLEIKKHSALVANNLTNFQQRKIINSLLWIAKDQLKRCRDRRQFTTELNILKRIANIRRNDNRQVKENLVGLVSLVIEYNNLGKDKKIRGAFPFLSFVQIAGGTIGNTAKVTFELATPILEAMKDPTMYVKLNLLIQRNLTEKYGYALYEILKDYANLARTFILIEALRTSLGVPKGKYTGMNMFKKRVLDVAIEKINEKTELKASYELEREGRKVVGIWFTVKGQNLQQAKDKQEEKIIERLQFFGIKKQQIQTLIKEHDHDYILANIAVVEENLKKKGHKIRNATAYLMKAFVVDYRPVTSEFEKSKKVAALPKKQAGTPNLKEKAKQEMEASKSQIDDFKKQRREKVALRINALQQKELDHLKAQFMEELSKNTSLFKWYQSKGMEHPIVKGRWEKFVGKQFLKEEEYDFEAFKKRMMEE